MTQYVKVTLKEFLDMRDAIESNAPQAASGSDYDMEESNRAVKAARTIEKRNHIDPPPYIQ